MRYDVLPSSKISDSLRRRLNELTLGRAGMMSHELQKEIEHGGSGWVILATEHDRVVGWALAFPRYSHFHLMVFVESAHRRRGIGSVLVEMAVAKTQPISVVAGTDEAAYLFYRHRVRLNIDDRWDGRTGATKREKYGWPGV